MNARAAIVRTVLDGDTIVLRTIGNSFSSRARWIDAPETRKWVKPETPINVNQWNWGERAKLQLVQLLANRQLLIVERSRDFYGRSLCDWYLDDLNLRNNLQIQLVSLGMAAHFLPINLYDFPGNDLDLYCEILRATAEAKQNKIGFWSDPKFVLPYQYRKSGKL